MMLYHLHIPHLDNKLEFSYIVQIVLCGEIVKSFHALQHVQSLPFYVIQKFLFVY